MKCETRALNVIWHDDTATDETLPFLNAEVHEFNVIDRGHGIVEISNRHATSYLSDGEVSQWLDQLLLIDDLFPADTDIPVPVIFDPARQPIHDRPVICREEYPTARQTAGFLK